MAVLPIPISPAPVAPTGAQVIEDILEETYGHEERGPLELYDEHRLGWRRIAPDYIDTTHPDTRVVVDEHVPMMLMAIEPGVAVFESVAMSIGAIDYNWGVYDIERSKRNHFGESTQGYIEAAEAEQVADKKQKIQDLEDAMRSDWEGIRKGRKSLWQGGPSGGF